MSRRKTFKVISRQEVALLLWRREKTMVTLICFFFKFIYFFIFFFVNQTFTIPRCHLLLAFKCLNAFLTFFKKFFLAANHNRKAVFDVTRVA